MKIKLNRNTAAGVMNCIRQAAMTRIPVLRPIAFAVGETCDVVDIGDYAEEDMTEFISNITSMEFQYSGNSEVVKFAKVCKGVLQASDLVTSEIKVARYDVTEVLHTSIPQKVEIYFRFSDGMHRKEDNESFLQANGIDTSKLVVINSRHCAMENFFAKELVEESTPGEVVYDVSVMTNSTHSQADILEQAIKSIAADLMWNIKS